MFERDVSQNQTSTALEFDVFKEAEFCEIRVVDPEDFDERNGKRSCMAASSESIVMSSSRCSQDGAKGGNA